MKIYDLRSDTLTKPDEGMRKAMASAEVGDDVYGEDPTINMLQQKAAELTGKEASLFVPSGSMGNLVPIYINGGKGGEVLAQENSHIFHYELGSMASLAGAMPVQIKAERGILTPEVLEDHVRPDIYYMSPSRLIVLENSHNKEGGTCYKKKELEAVFRFSREKNLKVHIDGARVFNASAATGMTVKEIASYTDTITFCLSKGLGAPVGSMLCGSAEFIAQARIVRKMLGGGMRQAGVLAAAGLYALENNVTKLKQDHVNAKALAAALAETSWAVMDPERVETNILYFGTGKRPAAEIVAMLQKKGIRSSAMSARSIRFVTHLDFSVQDTKEVISIIKNLQE